MRKILSFTFLLLFLFFIFKSLVYGLMGSILQVDDLRAENRPLFGGEILRQTFVCPEDEFGAIGIKVDNNNRLNDDFWIFRIKEKEEEEWYFKTKKYITDFQGGVFYPIGFPKITNAKGKEFIFEIESERGRENNQASVFLTLEDIYPEGEALVNGKKIGGDLVFTVYKETPAERLILDDFRKKIYQDKVFFIFWFGLILSLLLFVLIKF